MKKNRKLEVQSTFAGNIMLQDTDGNIVMYDETHKDLTDDIYDLIASHYPSALKALQLLYKGSRPNAPFFRYKVVSRFLKCNLGVYDTNWDIEPDGAINLEFVSCPLRGECVHENVICRPQLHNPLSRMEFKVMKHLYYGKSLKEIAEILSIAENTCKSHKYSAMRKVNCGRFPDFVRYAGDNNLFANN
jgi:DNA-binding CsgD family transcriptional regulator